MAPKPPAAPKPAPPKPAPPKPQPQLQQVLVGFRQGNDGKDDDTSVTITLKMPDQIIFAQASGTFGGEFGSNGYAGAFTIPILSSAPRLLYNQGCSLTIAINPIGHDTWNFDCDLFLIFDGAVPERYYNFPGHTLNQDVRSNTFQVPAV